MEKFKCYSNPFNYSPLTPNPNSPDIPFSRIPLKNSIGSLSSVVSPKQFSIRLQRNFLQAAAHVRHEAMNKLVLAKQCRVQNLKLHAECIGKRVVTHKFLISFERFRSRTIYWHSIGNILIGKLKQRHSSDSLNKRGRERESFRFEWQHNECFSLPIRFIVVRSLLT